MVPTSDRGADVATDAEPRLRGTSTVTLVEQIRSRILSGWLRPGELLNQKGLAEELGVSRIPLREALNILGGEGLLVMEPGIGTRVRLFDEAGIKELYEVRRTLEATLAESLVERATPGDIDGLHEVLAVMDNTSEISVWCDLNNVFHNRLYQLSGRATTERVLQQLNAQAEPYRRMFLRISGNVAVAQRQHHGMIRLLSTRDVAGLAELMSEHIFGALGPLRPVIVELQNDMARTRGRFIGSAPVRKKEMVG